MNPRDTLVHLREWLTGHRETHTRHFGESDQSGHPHGYAGIVIPEWDLRQRLDEIQESLRDAPPGCDYQQQYNDLVDSLCSRSWRPRNDHQSVLKLAKRLHDNQLEIRAMGDIPQRCTRAEGHDGPCNGFPAKTCKTHPFREVARARQSIEYLARIEYEAQMKSADVPALPWTELSETHKGIARDGIRAVLEALEVSQ